jgi:KaiC/GvpD/RAD55 family RecA-like ATPase
MVVQKKIRTYIEGLDLKLDGGIPAKSIVLIAGTTGTMKTSLSYHILYHNALQAERYCGYISLEQKVEDMLAQMTGLGYDVSAVKNRLSLVDISVLRLVRDELQAQNFLEVFKMYVDNYRRRWSLLAIDSLQVFELLARLDMPRLQLFSVFKWLRDCGLTTLIVTELPSYFVTYTNTFGFEFTYGVYGEDYLADGIFHLMLEPTRKGMRRKFRCVKLRKSRHALDEFTLICDREQFKVIEAIG